MRVKAKTWGVIGKKNFQGFSFHEEKFWNKNKTKSRLQTVLITASGPQAFNALVHRERYTQGSRQNRCVSSQEALALGAKARGNRGGQCPSHSRPVRHCCLWARLIGTVRPTALRLGRLLLRGAGQTASPLGTVGVGEGVKPLSIMAPQ